MAQKALPYSYGFDESSPTGWTKTSCHSNTTNYNLGSSGTHDGSSYVFRFYYNTNPPQYLISPELAVGTKDITVSFWYKAYNASYEESFKVGYSTDNDLDSFTWCEEVKTKSTTWTEYSTTCPAGTKFVCIAYTANDKYYLYIDEFKVEEPEDFASPKDFEFTGYTATSASFTWTNGSNETAWQIAYSTTSGFDPDGVTPVDVTEKPYTLTGLTAETTYYARIRADYGSGNYSKWSTEETSFKPSAAINTTINDGSSSNGYVPFYGSYADTDGTMSQFITPSSSLTAIQDRQITKLTFYGTANLNFGTAKFKVYMKETDATSFANTTFDWTDMEEVADASVSTDSEGKMVIELESPFDYSDGNLMIGFKISATGSWKSTSWQGVSSTESAIYSYNGNSYSAAFLPKMTIASLPQIVSVKKPKNLAASDVATTTAVLSWTDGEEGLSAWQIAYATDADFNPDTDGTQVAVDANPFTLTGLTSATTYYAYIRAEKGGEYSAWSNKVEFTTLSAAPVIELSTTSHSFGLVSDATAQALTLTINNTGGAALTDLSVTASTGFAVTDEDGNVLTATTIAASSSLIVKVKMSALGQQDGTITISGASVEPQTVTVSGYLLDETKICETFATAASVSRWTVASGWTFNATNGAYSGTSSRTMTTPKLTVATGDVLALNVKLGWSGGSLIVEGLDDEGNTVYDAVTYNASNGGLNTSSYTLLTISDMPATVSKVKLTGYYAYINVFNGFTYANDPVLGVFSNEACTSAQTSPATKNFGFATEAQEQKYYIKNTGNGQIDLTIDAPTGFTAEVASTELGEGESTALTVTMTATEGLHDGTITVTAKNHDNDAVLGTFVVNANGGITGTKNNVVLTAFPAGWQNNNWTISNGAARNWSATSSDLITTTLSVADGDQLLVEAYKYYSDDDSQLSYSYSTDNGATWSDAVSLTDQLTTNYKIIAISGIPAGNVLMKFTGTYSYIRQIYGFEAFAEPILTFTASDYSFGMINAAKTTDAYTLKNDGTAALNNLSVTCDNSNFTIAVSDGATSILTGSEVTFTVTLNTATVGLQEGTVTVAGTDVESKTFKVSGYVADGTKIFTTFSALPEHWTNTGNYWSFSENGATATSSSSKLESPKIVVAEGQKLAISAMLRYSGSSYYVTINGSDDNGATWTAYTKTLNNSQLNNTTYTVVELDDIPTTVNKLQLVGYYVYVNGLNGFTYDDNDPQLGVFSDSEFASEITTGSTTNSWGFVSEDKTATYYIKNTGTGTMTLSKTDAPAGFTATLGATSLGAGENTTLVISMTNDAATNEGYHAGDVVLTATDNNNNTLGTFTVTSSGVVVGSKADINFTTLAAFPAGWETTTWTVTANEKATVGYSTGTLTTGTYSVADGETMVVLAKRNSNWGTLSYKTSTDGGATWSDATTITPSSTSNYELKVIEGVPAGENVKIQFTGYYADIQRIYGFTAVAKPVITLSPADASYDFGMQTAAAEYVITVTNSGTATMENLAATLATGEDYEASVTATIVEPGASTTITVTQKYDASKGLASLSDVLTISADGVADKTINLSGKTRDASKWYVDFASEIPSSFVEKGSWAVSSGAARTTSSTENSLITQPINLAANEKIQFEACNPFSGSLKVRYSVNGGISWSDYVDYTSAISTTSSTFSSHEIDLGNTEDVTAIVEFCGRYYIQLDNIYGGALNNAASMIRVTKGGSSVENGATEAFGSIMTEATATYTISNLGNGTLTITELVTTGDADAVVGTTSLATGESTTLTITMPVAAPYGDKSGAVTVTTSLGDFVVNYTAATLNPNALNEQFASGKPAGWYFGGYWEVENQQAQNTGSGVADLITEQLTVVGTSEVLTFQAARTSNYSPATFKVYTSQDRVTWNEVDLGGMTLATSYKDVTISGLTAGDYYVKISGARVKVDNFLGWEKKNNTHDLYVTATNIPTTLAADYTATATVTSLLAAEEGVYAKLFFGDTEIATSEAANVALNGSTTFTMTATEAPEEALYEAKIVVYYSDGTVAFTTGTTTVGTLVLKETEAFAAAAGTYGAVKLNRTFNAGWNTVCLPFAAGYATTFFGEGAKAYAFTGYENGALKFERVYSLQAGVPYIVYVAEAFSEKTLTNVTITDETAATVEFGGAILRGTYAPVAAGEWTKNLDNDVIYGVTPAGKIAKAGASASIKGFRAYFDLPAGAEVKAMLFDGDDATAIQRIDLDGAEDEVIYDLNGRRVNSNASGVLIINGKKVLKK